MFFDLSVHTMHGIKWYFTKHELEQTPSRKIGITAERELSYRQQSAKLVQDMGQRLQVSQLAINTAIVYMHRFYMYHTFSRFHRHAIAPAALFLAAKVEEQPRKLEHVIKIASYFVNSSHVTLDIQSDAYAEKAQELVMNENILLQTLGFDVAIDHPHTYVVKCFQMVRALANLPQTSYFMATNSLHMTTMCLQYKPAVVACVCIDIVCKWSNYEIQRYTEGKDWFVHVDSTVTAELLEKLSAEFIAVLDKFPNRLKKVKSMNSVQHGTVPNMEYRPRSTTGSLSTTSRPTSSSSRSHESANKEAVAGSSKAQHAISAPKTVLNYKEYNEKKEKERREKERHSAQISSSHPVSSSSQRAQLDQLRMPPPQVVPIVRPPNSSRDTHPRKEPGSSDKQDRASENHDNVKCQEKIISEQNQCLKNSEHIDINKVPDRTKHNAIKHKSEKVDVKNIKPEPNITKLAPPLSIPKQPINEMKPSTDINTSSHTASTVCGTNVSAVIAPVVKKESTSHNASQSSNKVKPVHSSVPVSLYHPRLDGKPKSNKPANLPQPSISEEVPSLPKPQQTFNPKDDVTTISSISKLISQSITKAPKEHPDFGPAAITSTSHTSSKRHHKSEHSHKHDKDKKKKKSKHKSKDKKEKHKERDSKDHKKSKKQKKHKEKDKERDVKESKHNKPSFETSEVDTSVTPIKLTIIRDKGVYTPEASQIPSAKTAPSLTDVSLSGSAAMSSTAGSGGLKITIPKSRLQASIPQASPPRGIPPRNSHTPNVKLKIPKEKLKYDRDSRKRDRSPSRGSPPNKYLRTSGGINLQKVLDTARWSSQGH